MHNAWHGVAMGPVGCNFVCFECLRLKWLLWFYNFSPTNTHYKTRYSPHSWVLPFSQFLIVLGHSQQLAILCKEAHDGQKVIYFSFCFQIVKFPPFGRLNCVFLPFFFWQKSRINPANHKSRNWGQQFSSPSRGDIGHREGEQGTQQALNT